MGTPDKYRFTVQWGADSAEKIQIGEALKSLGNRKSKLIVEAVSDYIKTHPESLSPGYKFHTAIEPALTQNQVEAIVRDMIDARLANITPVAQIVGDPSNHSAACNPDIADNDIDIMIQNLDLFA